MDLQDGERTLNAEWQEFRQPWETEGKVTLKLSPLEKQASSSPLNVQRPRPHTSLSSS